MNQYITEENFEKEVERTVAALKAGKKPAKPTKQSTERRKKRSATPPTRAINSPNVFVPFAGQSTGPMETNNYIVPKNALTAFPWIASTKKLALSKVITPSESESAKYAANRSGLPTGENVFAPKNASTRTGRNGSLNTITEPRLL